ncbi:hypothetical protein HR060_09595 [Catenovulum sp. SM1970]|uniref:hypothetical protein n=1 Tax=Marinifaba aquimaris TaxID=2741323 RepID=UPI001572ED01|nr:hypothetical protein [Marinifaba aquimaris]NTS77126.1 hypothetical protein [Marinifaba aquimaris]
MQSLSEYHQALLTQMGIDIYCRPENLPLVTEKQQVSSHTHIVSDGVASGLEHHPGSVDSNAFSDQARMPQHENAAQSFESHTADGVAHTKPSSVSGLSHLAQLKQSLGMSDEQTASNQAPSDVNSASQKQEQLLTSDEQTEQQKRLDTLASQVLSMASQSISTSSSQNVEPAEIATQDTVTQQDDLNVGGDTLLLNSVNQTEQEPLAVHIQFDEPVTADDLSIACLQKDLAGLGVLQDESGIKLENVELLQQLPQLGKNVSLAEKKRFIWHYIYLALEH